MLDHRFLPKDNAPDRTPRVREARHQPIGLREKGVTFPGLCFDAVIGHSYHSYR